jgi:hypothetical protein
MSRWRLGVLATAGCVAALAGCGSSGGPAIPKSKMSKLVLQPSDLPRGFSAFYFGKQLTTDQTGARADPRRFGREGGWIGRYNRGGSPKTNGPLVVVSRVDVFGNAGGAKKDFALYPHQLEQAGANKIDVGRLGDGAFGVAAIQTGAVTVRSYAIAWRQDNATAELEANGFRLTTPQVLALARKQETRLRQAAR